MRKAEYKLLPGKEGFYSEIPGFQGVYANAENIEDCRNELRSVLEEWLLFHLSDGTDVPVVDGMDLKFKKENAT